MRDRIQAGTRVRIQDYSEAHNDTGTVYLVVEDSVLVELDGTDGTLWPCAMNELVEANDDES